MTWLTPTYENVDIILNKGNKFGRYPKISMQQCWNFIVSDEFLVNFAGFIQASQISLGTGPRQIYASKKNNILIVVMKNQVWLGTTLLAFQRIGEIDTFSGTVQIAENNAGQIAICDFKNIYIYTVSSSAFVIASIDFVPGGISYAGTYFLSPILETSLYRLSDPENGLSWPTGANLPSFQGQLERKADNIQGILAMPGQGNMILLIGSSVIEIANQVPGNLFPFQKSSSVDIDFGVANIAAMAALENWVVWLGQNEKAGLALYISQGGPPKEISNDGLTYIFNNLLFPNEVVGFLYKQDGHLIYQFTFYRDNKSYIWDFETQLFFSVSDHKYNFHPAQNVVAFNNTYYFITFTDGYIYELNSIYTTLNGEVCPRSVVSQNVRYQDARPFNMNNLSLTVETGYSDTPQAIDLNISYNGGRTFSSNERQILPDLGYSRNMVTWYNLGYSNDFVFQFQCWGDQRFVIGGCVGGRF